MPLFWTPESVQDREGIYDFIAADNPVAAMEMDEMFSEKALCLLDHPKLGRLGRMTGTRELVVHANYILVYDVKGDRVRVLRLLHAARRWPQLL